MLRHRSRAFVGALLAGVSALGLAATAPVTGAALAQPPSWSGTGELADLVEHVSPAVVQITARRPGSAMTVLGEDELPEMFRDSPFRFFFGPEFGAPDGQNPPRAPEMMAGGSGFLVDRTGVIVTNNHVVEHATNVTITLKDGRELDAQILGTDPKTDLAVLKVDATDLPEPVAWGDSNEARVGDPIFAMGAPFGLGGTVTAGIISARGRDLGSGPYDDFIQVDAPINRGNSGGPLFDSAGHVIGVNSQIYSPSGGNVGIGFAIPSELAQSVVREIVENGEVDRGWLGVAIQPVTQEIADSLGLDDAQGAIVADVNDDSPAQHAGLEVGDVITRFGDTDVTDVHDLTRAVADTDRGDRVRVKLVRDGRERDVRVTIGRMPNESEHLQTASADTGGDSTGLVLDRLGLRLSDDAGGAVVADVAPGGPADEAGLRPGDHVVRVNQDDVSSADEASDAVHEASREHRTAVLLQIERGGQKRFVGVPFALS